MLELHIKSVKLWSGQSGGGSASRPQGFDVVVEIKPKLQAYRVAVAWAADDGTGWRYEECRLTEGRDGSELWSTDVRTSSVRQLKFTYAVVAAGPDGMTWDNNHGQNHSI